ncbi:hypothetical protein ACLB2K_007597 [Fragaria x ananassa]
MAEISSGINHFGDNINSNTSSVSDVEMNLNQHLSSVAEISSGINLFGDNINSNSSCVSDVEMNLNQRLSSVLLNEHNYLGWARAITLTLGGKSKLGYVNGYIQKPDVGSSSYDSWLSKDQLVMSWLVSKCAHCHLPHQSAGIVEYLVVSLPLKC